MATGFISYSTQHGVVETSDMLATTGGAHIYNVIAAANIDNGAIISKGAWNTTKKAYAEAAASNTFAAKVIDTMPNGMYLCEVTAVGTNDMIVATPVVIYEDWTKKMQEESNFFNAKDDIVKGIVCAVGDRFAVNAAAISGTVVVGTSVLKVSSKKLTVQA